jgi:hypothetical protein
MAFYEAAGVPERSPVGPMRSQHRTVLYKRHLRYWPLILLASDSRHLLKDFTSCAPRVRKHHSDLYVEIGRLATAGGVQAGERDLSTRSVS